MSQPDDVPSIKVDAHWIAPEISPRWVRVRFGGDTIADSKRTILLREAGQLPVYYFPKEDVRMDLLDPSEHRSLDAAKGPAAHWSVKAGGRSAEHAARSYSTPLLEWPEMGDYVTFAWNEMDTWLEEEEEIFVHPRDPHKRIDTMPSSRHVQVVLDGVVVADSTRPSILFETHLPTRYYLPADDVRMDLLTPSATTSRCPYKGIASYWDVNTGDTVRHDYIWAYQNPIPECPKVKGLLCFFNERVDAIIVDGEVQPRPRNKWSQD